MAHPAGSVRNRTATCGAAAALLAASAFLAAGQTTYVKDAPGTWKPWKMTIASGPRAAAGASAAELKAFEANLVAFREILRRAPSAATPVGYSVEVWGHLRGDSPRAPGQPPPAALPLAGGVSFGAFSIFEILRGGKPVRIDTGETALLQFAVNDLSPGTIGRPGPPEWHVIEHDVIEQPPATGERAGFPRYDDIVVITRRSGSVWAPVSLLEAWELQLRTATHGLAAAQDVADKLQQARSEQVDPSKKAAREAGYRRTASSMPDPAAYLAQMAEVERVRDKVTSEDVAPTSHTMTRVREAARDVAVVQALIAGLTAEAKVAPACWIKNASRLDGKFRRDPDARCPALVRPNYALFDRSLPRSAPQVLIIQGARRCHEDLRDPTVLTTLAGNCAANKALLESWDRQAVLDWLR